MNIDATALTKTVSLSWNLNEAPLTAKAVWTPGVQAHRMLYVTRLHDINLHVTALTAVEDVTLPLYFNAIAHPQNAAGTGPLPKAECVTVYMGDLDPILAANVRSVLRAQMHMMQTEFHLALTGESSSR